MPPIPGLSARVLLPLCLAAGLVLPFAARSQDFDTDAIERLARRLFYSMDLDKNGEVSRDEYAHTEGGGFKVEYSKLDRNADGTLTWDEYIDSVRHFHPPGPPKQAL